MRSFVDRVAAITATASGIGRTLALELAAAALPSHALRRRRARARRDGAAGRGTRRQGWHGAGDVAQRDEVHRWADAVARQHGRVTLVFNNVGVGLGATIEAMSYEDFEWLMGIDFCGVVHGTKAFLPDLKAPQCRCSGRPRCRS